MLRKEMALVLALGLFAPAAWGSLQHPNIERGFSPEKAYDFGDIDNVNLFNGNLTLTIPLGPSYPVGGGFSYRLQLVYNSHLWDWEQICAINDPSNCATRAVANRDSNAGFGWQLTLGKLVPPFTPPRNDGSQWLYVSPDGAEHRFYGTLHATDADDPGDSLSSQAVLYSRDGSYLRLGLSSTGVKLLESPDGTSRTFDGQNRLTSIQGRFGNDLTVDYSQPQEWILTDSTGRSQTLHFGLHSMDSEAVGDGTTTQLKMVELVDSIDFASFGGTPTTVTFQYQTADVDRACPNNDPIFPPQATVTMLTAVTLQDGSSFSMPLGDYFVTAPQNCKAAGAIRGTQLPTGGRLEWDWTTYTFPSGSGLEPGASKGQLLGWLTSSLGVSARRTVDLDGTTGKWTYVPHLVVPPQSSTQEEPVEATRTVTDPLLNVRVHYFSAYAGGLTSVAAARESDYGLPFSPARPDGSSPGRFLSMEVEDPKAMPDPVTGAVPDLRTTYVLYTEDPRGGSFADDRLRGYNARPVSERTVYDDDGGKVADTQSTDFDGLGHFRRTTTGGNLPGQNIRTTVTDYNPSRGTYDVDPATLQPTAGSDFQMLAPTEPWVLGTYAGMSVTEGGDTERTELCFEKQTGWLAWKRVLLGSVESPKDVLLRFTRDIDAQGHSMGNLVREDDYGGDPGGLPPTPKDAGCSLPEASLPAAQYSIQHEYQSGVLARSQFLDCANGALLTTEDLTIDSSTGLPSASRDPSGVETTFTYDALGRLVRAAPAGEAPTEITYTPALAGAGARADVVRKTDQGVVLAESQVRFDGLGRLAVEREHLPGSWNQRLTEYYGTGWKKRVSEIQADGTSGAALRWTTFKDYDPFGRPGTIVPPDGAAHNVTLSYTGVASVVRKLHDVAGTTATTFELYDRFGRLISVNQAAGPNGEFVVTNYGYDVGSRLASVSTKAPENVTQIRRFTYDHRGFLQSEKQPELGQVGNGVVQYLDYDARGHAHTKKSGQLTGGGFARGLSFTYDRAERLTQVRDSGGDLLKEFFFGRANGTGDLVQGKLYQAKRHNLVPDPAQGGQLHDLVVTETYRYGGPGGRVSQRLVRASPGASFTQTFAYDALGDLTSQSYPQCDRPPCTGVAPARTVGYGFTFGRLTSVPGFATSITYHPNGLVHQVLHGNGVIYTIDNDPDSMRRPHQIEVTISLSTPALGPYAYDGAGNITAIGDETYSYDLVSRLRQGTLGSGDSQAYAYDSFGNITSIATTPNNGSTVTRTLAVDPATNRLSAGPMASYDPFGNQTSWGTITYGYDEFDMLSSLRSGSKQFAYAYTAEDERLMSLDLTTGEAIWRLRGLGNQVLREYKDAAGTWSWDKDYVYRGSTLLASVSATDGLRHYHPDHLGTPRLITDAGGNVVAGHHYYPFGEELQPQTDEVMKFTGHERDFNDEPGAGDDLDYMHARYYNPMLGRFLSVDPFALRKPVAEPQRWMRYGYAQNNPLKFLDPDGKEVLYANPKDRKFYEAQARRNWRVRAVLDAFGPGSGRNLYINRGNPGAHRNGTPRAARTNIDFGRQPSQQEMIDAYEAAGGSKSPEAAEKAANAVYEAAANDVVTATVTLGSHATAHNKLHEFGHIDQALKDPITFKEQAAAAADAPTDEAYRDSPSEEYAEKFADEAAKKRPEPR